MSSQVIGSLIDGFLPRNGLTDQTLSRRDMPQRVAGHQRPDALDHIRSRHAKAGDLLWLVNPVHRPVAHPDLASYTALIFERASTRFDHASVAT